jgi:DNA mismatch repair ATPase MutS
MERQQDSIIMDAATRRNLEITQNLAGGVENTLAAVLDSTVTPMGSRMLKRWLHMPVRDTATLVGRQQTIAALQDRFTELQPVLRQVGDLERILARLALRTARPRDLARMRHAFQQLPGLRTQLAEVESAPVQKLRETMGEFSELRELLERAVVEAPPVLVRDGGDNVPDSDRDQVIRDEIHNSQVRETFRGGTDSGPELRACKIADYDTHRDHKHVCNTVLKAAGDEHRDRQNHNHGFVHQATSAPEPGLWSDRSADHQSRRHQVW